MNYSKSDVVDEQLKTEVEDNSTEERNLVLEIPDDCMYVILTQLSIDERLIFEGVCKRWRAISCQGWRDIKQLYPGMYNAENFCWILQRCGSYLHRLHVEFAPKDNKNHASYNEKYIRNAVLFTEVIREHCFGLKSIIVNWSPLIDYENVEKFWKNMQIILESNQKLETIQLRSIKATEIQKFIEFIPRNLNELHLTLIANEFQRYAELSVDLSQFERLEVLSLHRFHLTGSSLQINEKMNNLKFLSINKCSFTSEFIYNLSKLVNLEHLKVSSLAFCSFDLSSGEWQCAKLKILDLYGLCILNDTIMNAIVTYCPNLEELRLDRNFFICRARLPGFQNLRKLLFYDWGGHSYHRNQIADVICHSPKLTHLEATYEAIHPYLHEIDGALSRRSSQLPLNIQLKKHLSRRVDLQFENLSKLLSITYM